MYTAQSVRYRDRRPNQMVDRAPYSSVYQIWQTRDRWMTEPLQVRILKGKNVRGSNLYEFYFKKWNQIDVILNVFLEYSDSNSREKSRIKWPLPESRWQSPLKLCQIPRLTVLVRRADGLRRPVQLCQCLGAGVPWYDAYSGSWPGPWRTIRSAPMSHSRMRINDDLCVVSIQVSDHASYATRTSR